MILFPISPPTSSVYLFCSYHSPYFITISPLPPQHHPTFPLIQHSCSPFPFPTCPITSALALLTIPFASHPLLFIFLSSFIFPPIYSLYLFRSHLSPHSPTISPLSSRLHHSVLSLINRHPSLTIPPHSSQHLFHISLHSLSLPILPISSSFPNSPPPPFSSFAPSAYDPLLIPLPKWPSPFPLLTC